MRYLPSVPSKNSLSSFLRPVIFKKDKLPLKSINIITVTTPEMPPLHTPLQILPFSPPRPAPPPPPPNKVLYVGGLLSDTNSAGLNKYFSEVYNLLDSQPGLIRVKILLNHNQTEAYALAYYETIENATAAMKDLNNAKTPGTQRPLQVTYATSPKTGLTTELPDVAQTLAGNRSSNARSQTSRRGGPQSDTSLPEWTPNTRGPGLLGDRSLSAIVPLEQTKNPKLFGNKSLHSITLPARTANIRGSGLLGDREFVPGNYNITGDRPLARSDATLGDSKYAPIMRENPGFSSGSVVDNKVIETPPGKLKQEEELKKKEFWENELRLKEQELKKNGLRQEELRQKEKEFMQKELREIELREKVLREKVLREKELREKELREKELRAKELREKELREKELREKGLREKELREKELREKELREKELRVKELREKELREKELREKELREKELREKELREKELREKGLREKELREKELREKEFREKELREKELREKELREKELREKELREKELREKRLREKELREKGLREKGLREKELREKELREKELREKELREKGLREKVLREKELREKELREKELRAKELREKELREKELREKGLREKELQEKEINALRSKQLMESLRKEESKKELEEATRNEGGMLRTELTTNIIQGLGEKGLNQNPLQEKLKKTHQELIDKKRVALVVVGEKVVNEADAGRKTHEEINEIVLREKPAYEERKQKPRPKYQAEGPVLEQEGSDIECLQGNIRHELSRNISLTDRLMLLDAKGPKQTTVEKDPHVQKEIQVKEMTNITTTPNTSTSTFIRPETTLAGGEMGRMLEISKSMEKFDVTEEEWDDAF
ncbi:hypothetical protein DFP73DRAFT_4892 [Morchella snyderi]|nr:hypothetical protein DFP73DRAFT_4892 [Morchella snyderi]